MYTASVRTTITIPDDLHAILTSLSQDKRQTISQTIEDFVRRGLEDKPAPYRKVHDPETGFLSLEFDRPVTTEDVRSLEDDE